MIPINPDDVVNVVPDADMLDHRDGVDCPCQPHVECEGTRTLIVHHAWDCREYFEADAAETATRHADAATLRGQAGVSAASGDGTSE